MRVKLVLAATAGALAGGVALFVVGAFLGGNVTPHFEFAGLRGYEATGVLGLMVGLVAGGALGLKLARKRRA